MIKQKKKMFSNNLCKYKDVLGKPNEGLHQYKFFGLAVVDLMLTALLSLFLSSRKNGRNMEKKFCLQKFLFYFFGLWVFGTILHVMFCVDTPVSKKFF